MLIESIIRRKNGTTVTLDDFDYLFAPRDGDERHTAEVEHQGHIAHLLAIKEGFRAADGTIPPQMLAATQEFDGPFFIVRGPQDLQAFAQWASSIPSLREQPAEFVLLTDKIAFGEADLGSFAMMPLESVVPAFSNPPAPATASGTPASQPSPGTPATNSIVPDQSQSGTSGGAETSDSVATGDGGGGAAGGAAAEETEDDPAERERLAVTYADIIGHRPNGKWKIAKIAAAIAEHQG